MQSFDIDGVIFIDGRISGVRPYINDIIVTGRSFEEKEETERMLQSKGLGNKVFYNPLKFDDKTRVSSGVHKGITLRSLIARGFDITAHYEDDEIQIAEIEKYVDIPIIHIKHNLTEKENRRN